jgi:hypothetical protein
VIERARERGNVKLRDELGPRVLHGIAYGEAPRLEEIDTVY